MATLISHSNGEPFAKAASAAYYFFAPDDDVDDEESSAIKTHSQAHQTLSMLMMMGSTETMGQLANKTLLLEYGGKEGRGGKSSRRHISKAQHE